MPLSILGKFRTIKSLRLGFHHVHSLHFGTPVSISRIKFPNLEELEFSYHCDSTLRQKPPLTPWDVLACLNAPSLRSLQIHSLFKSTGTAAGAGIPILKWYLSRYPNLTHLVLELSKTDVDDDIMAKLSETQGLKKLKVGRTVVDFQNPEPGKSGWLRLRRRGERWWGCSRTRPSGRPMASPLRACRAASICPWTIPTICGPPMFARWRNITEAVR